MATASSESFADSSRALRELHASRRICCSVRQQSASVVNEIWKQKFINNFNYFLQKNNTKIALQRRHCRVKLVLLYVIIIIIIIIRNIHKGPNGH